MVGFSAQHPRVLSQAAPKEGAECQTEDNHHACSTQIHCLQYAWASRYIYLPTGVMLQVIKHALSFTLYICTMLWHTQGLGSDNWNIRNGCPRFLTHLTREVSTLALLWSSLECTTNWDGIVLSQRKVGIRAQSSLPSAMVYSSLMVLCSRTGLGNEECISDVWESFSLQAVYVAWVLSLIVIAIIILIILWIAVHIDQWSWFSVNPLYWFFTILTMLSVTTDVNMLRKVRTLSQQNDS